MSGNVKHNSVWMFLLNSLLILVSLPAIAESPETVFPVSGIGNQTLDITQLVRSALQNPSTENFRLADAQLIPNNKFASNWWMKAGWDNYGKLPDITLSRDYVFISENASLRKINWSRVAWNMAEPYTACLELEFLLQDYQDMLHSRISTLSYQLLEKARNQSSHSDSQSLLWLSQTLAFLSAGKIGPGIIRLNPNIVPNHYGLNCSYRIGYGLINYSWDMDRDRYSIKVRIPLYQIHSQTK